MLHYMMFRFFKELLYKLAGILGLFHHGLIVQALLCAIIGGVAYKIFYRPRKRTRRRR